MNKTGDPSTDLRERPGTVGSPVVLVGAMISVFGTVATFLLVRLRADDAQGFWLFDRLLDGWFGDLLLLLALGLAIIAPLALIVVATISLMFGGTRSQGVRANPAGSVIAPPISPPRENGSWTKLVEECVDVVDELDRHMSGFDPPRQEIATHVILRLQEILGRSGVEIISGDVAYDPSRHKPDRPAVAATRGAHISETLSPGFALGRRVLRRARVRIDDF